MVPCTRSGSREFVSKLSQGADIEEISMPTGANDCQDPLLALRALGAWARIKKRHRGAKWNGCQAPAQGRPSRHPGLRLGIGAEHSIEVAVLELLLLWHARGLAGRESRPARAHARCGSPTLREGMHVVWGRSAEYKKSCSMNRGKVNLGSLDTSA